MRILASLFLGLATALASLAQAQDFPNRVGRIAHIEGRASLYQDPEGGWELAYVNSPITSENSVWTDEGSRAEVRVAGMAIRLDHLTQLDVARLDEDELDAFIARGTVAVRVRHYENNERLVFSTPNTRVGLRANGRYRIDVDPDRLETRITVFAGEARVGTDDGRMSIPAGRSMLVFGASPPEFVDERVLTSAFDRWTVARDERWREGRAATYVSTNMTGYEDLDAYGSWATEPDYGVLWYPRSVSANWAPYRDGRWDYVRPWGWTWVDDAPWGYAPFHYGRWVYVRNRWAWHPGERVARPTWAPALVAFVGGSNFNFSISSGGTPVGWYPLSPWDRYDPWFQASPTYVNRVNVIVRNEPTRQDRRDWQRWTRERGTTVVDRRAMIEHRPVRQAVVPISADVIRQVQAAPQPSAVLPTRNDVLQRRRQQPQQAAPAPMVVAQPAAPVKPGAPAQARSERSAIARPDFGRNAVVATPRRASAPPAERAATSPLARDAQRQTQQRQAREAQQQTQQQQQAQERAQREQQQALERQTKERAQQQQQQQAKEREAQGKAQQQQQAQERAQREQQQALERQTKERAQQQQQQQAKEREAQGKAQQQQQAQERAQREQQQALERQTKERAQQQQQQQAKEREAQGKAQQQQQAQERAQREQQQTLERQTKERAQQQQQQQAKEREAQGKAQQQQQAQERAQREQQQTLERQTKERAQQQQQQQAKDREAQGKAQQQQQAQERAQREQQQAQAQAAQQAKAQAAEQAAKGKGRDDAPSRQREEEEEKEKEKGKGKK